MRGVLTGWNISVVCPNGHKQRVDIKRAVIRNNKPLNITCEQCKMIYKLPTVNRESLSESLQEWVNDHK